MRCKILYQSLKNAAVRILVASSSLLSNSVSGEYFKEEVALKQVWPFSILYAVKILLRSKEIELLELDFVLQFGVEHTYKSPVDFLTTQSWSAIKVGWENCFSVLNLFWCYFWRHATTRQFQIKSYIPLYFLAELVILSKRSYFCFLDVFFLRRHVLCFVSKLFYP